MNTCYIIGAGDVTLLPRFDETDLVIAADGGYHALVRQGRRCDILIGDMDSIGQVPNEVERKVFPVRKDETDTYLAYLEGRARGYCEFELYGATGGRSDHTFANYSLLLKMANDGCHGSILFDTGTALVIKNDTITLLGTEGEHLSVFAIGREAHGVSVSGAEYECEGITLTPDFPLGVSNSFRRTPVTIEVSDGAILIITEE